MTAVAGRLRPGDGASPANGTASEPSFTLPPALEADRPPEDRGLARDEVGLLVSSRSASAAPAADGTFAHARFRDLPGFLEPGDLLVVNTSATLPAAVPASRRDGEPLELRLSTAVPQIGDREWWVVELRTASGGRPIDGGAPGDWLALPAGAGAELVAPYRDSPRLWIARVATAEHLHRYLERHGHPIRYGYIAGEPTLDSYQTVFALEPGSAEMASAARPFTPQLVTRLVAAGVRVAPVVLHAGVSSPEAGEPPYPERYAVSEPTAALVNATRASGARVIAVGTTVVRALEAAATPSGTVAASAGWTDLVVGTERPLRAIDGLITGWHEPRASHLDLLAAAAGPDLLERSYEIALEHRYLWHEFGDSHLILP